MLLIKMLIKALLVTKLCQSISIYQPRKGRTNHKIHAQLKSVNSTTLSTVGPHQQRSSEIHSLKFRRPRYSNIYADQYQHNDQRTAAERPKNTNANANEQPATADAALESEILHEAKSVTVKGKQQPSSVNYNQEIYHINTVKRASPLANNKNEIYSKLIVRKQRNLKENHDDKLIEQDIEVMKNANEDNDLRYTQAAKSSSALNKQPSSKMPSRPTTPISHEIRYLHDIFLNYPEPHHINFGHVELSPVLFEKRFETQKMGSRYKGEIMWLDNTGGFAQHYWDLAQGNL